MPHTLLFSKARGAVEPAGVTEWRVRPRRLARARGRGEEERAAAAAAEEEFEPSAPAAAPAAACLGSNRSLKEAFPLLPLLEERSLTTVKRKGASKGAGVRRKASALIRERAEARRGRGIVAVVGGGRGRVTAVVVAVEVAAAATAVLGVGGGCNAPPPRGVPRIELPEAVSGVLGGGGGGGGGACW